MLLSIQCHQDPEPFCRGWKALFHDLRFALRGLRRDRAFTLTAIAMLALAIGLNVTVFTVMNTMLFRGFPLVKRNDRLVYIQEQYPSGTCCILTSISTIGALRRTLWREWHSSGKRISASAMGRDAVDVCASTVSTNAFGLLRSYADPRAGFCAGG